MRLLQRIETRFGLTRGDVTLALFLSSTALAGFVYMTFFESDERLRNRTELARLVAYSDSIDRARSAEIERSLTQDPDSAERFEPLTADELLADQNGPRGRDLTLEDVAPIHLNSASLRILDLLPGVGETTAQLIAAERPFRRVDDITRVRGIGPKTFAKMRPWIVVDSDPEEMPGSDADSGQVPHGDGTTSALHDSANADSSAKPEIVPDQGDTVRDSEDSQGDAYE